MRTHSFLIVTQSMALDHFGIPHHHTTVLQAQPHHTKYVWMGVKNKTCPKEGRCEIFSSWSSWNKKLLFDEANCSQSSVNFQACIDSCILDDMCLYSTTHLASSYCWLLYAPPAKLPGNSGYSSAQCGFGPTEWQGQRITFLTIYWFVVGSILFSFSSPASNRTCVEVNGLRLIGTGPQGEGWEEHPLDVTEVKKSCQETIPS